MTSDAKQKCGKTESLDCHWLLALAMFGIMSFPDILWGIERHFKLCPYVDLEPVSRVSSVGHYYNAGVKKATKFMSLIGN